MSKEIDLGFLKDIDKRSSFSEVHVLKVLLLLEEEEMGRTKLRRELGLGEASVKTLLKYLVQENIVEPTTKGHSLTDRGREIVEKLRKRISGPLRLDSSELTVSEKNVAFLIKKASSGVKRGIKQRDAAIKAGAQGATTIVHEGGELQVEGVEIDLPERVKSKFDLEEGDVIIIGSASSQKKAEEGVLAAALTLL